MIIQLCDACGSQDVELYGCTATWSVSGQEWILGEDSDGVHCNDCDVRVDLIEKVLA